MGVKKGTEKNFVVKASPLYNFYIALEGGGEVPKILSGQYTTIALAERAIEKYLATRRKRVKKDA